MIGKSAKVSFGHQTGDRFPSLYGRRLGRGFDLHNDEQRKAVSAGEGQRLVPTAAGRRSFAAEGQDDVAAFLRLDSERHARRPG